jgi:hypothetical protein
MERALCFPFLPHTTNLGLLDFAGELFVGTSKASKEVRVALALFNDNRRLG